MQAHPHAHAHAHMRTHARARMSLTCASRLLRSASRRAPPRYPALQPRPALPAPCCSAPWVSGRPQRQVPPKRESVEQDPRPHSLVASGPAQLRVARQAQSASRRLFLRLKQKNDATHKQKSNKAPQQVSANQGKTEGKKGRGEAGPTHMPRGAPRASACSSPPRTGSWGSRM